MAKRLGSPIHHAGLALLLFCLVGTVAGCGGGGSSGSPTPGPNQLRAIVIRPANPSIAQGTTVQLIATGQFSNGQSFDITSSVFWDTSNSSIVSVSNKAGATGQATANGAGNATVTATLLGITGSTTVTGTAATLLAIAVTPINPQTPNGTTLQLSATGVFTDGTSQDLTLSAAWSSSTPSVATVQGGLVTTVGVGTSNIEAALNGISGSTTVTSTNASLQSIAITPDSPTLAQGTSTRLTATGTFSDGEVVDLTSTVSWNSSSGSVATVSNQPTTKGQVQAVSAGNTSVSAQLLGVSGSTPLTVTSAVLSSITITPANPVIPAGTSVQLNAIGTFSDGTSQDITGSVTWTSTDGSVATVIGGLVFGAAQGSATIGASLKGVEGSTGVTVTAATLTAIQVSPANPTVAQGLSVQLTATGVYSDGSTLNLTSAVSWASAATDVAEVSNSIGSQGLMTGVSPGTSTISASLNGISGSTNATITGVVLTSITITPIDPEIASGTNIQLTATGTFSDGSSSDLTGTVAWTSSDSAVASVVAGLVSGKSAGTVTITASQAGITDTTTVTISAVTLNSIVVTPAAPTIASGTTVQMTAIGQFSDGSTQNLTREVAWTSSVPAVATISNASGLQGLVTGISPGATNVTATLSGVAGFTQVTVTAATLTSIGVFPESLTLPSGTSSQLTAIGTFSDGTTLNLTSSVTWSSTNPAAVTVSNSIGSQGQVTGVASGTSNVSATLGAVSGSASVTVSSAVLSSITITPANPSVAKGLELQLTAIGTFSDGSSEDLTEEVVWSSSNTTIAEVSSAPGSQGLLSALARGQAVISARLPRSLVVGSTTITVTTATLSSITVEPVSVTVAAGTSEQLNATGVFSDGTSQDLTSVVNWGTSASSIAVVGDTTGTYGRVTGISAGNATITAEFNGVSGSSAITVTSAKLTSIEVTPAAPTIAKGTTVQLTATGQFSDGSTEDLTQAATWSSSAGSIATVSNTSGSQGLVTGVSPGTSTLAATFGGIAGSTQVAVTAATLTGIDVFPESLNIAAGVKAQLTAVGTFSDGTTLDLTSAATWTSGNPSSAVVSNLPGTRGQVTGVAPGIASVTARLESLAGSATVTVTTPTLSSITVTPVDPSIPKGTEQQFNATGTYTDGTTQDLTNSVTWTSSNTAVAQVSNAPGTQGDATGTGVGTTTITATMPQGEVSGSTSLTVSAATLTSITVEPPTASIAAGATVQLGAIGEFSDGSSFDLTSSVNWSTSSGAIAVVSDSAGSRGLVTGVSVGSATITANLQGVSGSSSITVTAATLTSITITPVEPSLSAGTSLQLTATGVYSDSSTIDLTDLVSWTSSNESVAIVDNTGLLTGIAAGNATVNARFEGVTASTAVTVTSAVMTSLIIQPVGAVLPPFGSQQMTATAVFSDGSTQDVTALASWTSDKPLTAWVSNRRHRHGLVTGVIPGSADIFAAYNGLSGSAPITVAILASLDIVPADPSVAAGESQRLSAIGSFPGISLTVDLTDFVSWSSSNTSVATVDNFLRKGRLTGQSPGTATIGANFFFGALTASTTATVTAATLNSITVTPRNPRIAVGSSIAMTATGNYSDGSTSDLTPFVTWTSSKQSVAQVSNAAGSEGQVTGVGSGSATIGASYLGVSGSTGITVTTPTLRSITITPANPTIHRFQSEQMTATGNYSDGTTQDLTAFVCWTASNPHLAQFDYSGRHPGLLYTYNTGRLTARAEYRGVAGTTGVRVVR
ncbi:MAG TPA: Ig-like domain-containing protein [Candidatus Binataceae bacterium]|nr:Ig-like domain-containing protein [Candidatus Binataceae bacterium]